MQFDIKQQICITSDNAQVQQNGGGGVSFVISESKADQDELTSRHPTASRDLPVSPSDSSATVGM